MSSNTIVYADVDLRSIYENFTITAHDKSTLICAGNTLSPTFHSVAHVDELGLLCSLLTTYEAQHQMWEQMYAVEQVRRAIVRPLLSK